MSLHSRLNGWQRLATLVIASWLSFVIFTAASGKEEISGLPFRLLNVRIDPPKFTPVYSSRPAKDQQIGSLGIQPENNPFLEKNLEVASADKMELRALLPTRHISINWTGLMAALLVPPLALLACLYVLPRIVKWVVDGFRRKET